MAKKVTKKDLMKFKVGEEKVFMLPTWEKARSAQSYARSLKNSSECPMLFTSKIGKAIEGTQQRSITIERIG